ncbi:MAG: hypothetical protein KDD22_01345 [Bdellovibrionales bacterium]|nr:hypothetical protein [Bdellovibrionales bacterium]
MKTYIFAVLAIALMGSFSAHAADTGLNASSLKLKVYKFAVSSSPLCTNLVTVVDNGTTPSEVNFIGGINLGSGSIANGTYPCVVVEFSDNIKFVPSSNSTSGNCIASTEYTLDVCQSGTSVLIDGTTTTCSNGDNKVAMYLSTASSSTTGSDAFNAPTQVNDSTKGFNLASSLTVSGSSSGSFVVSPSGKVCDGVDAGCDGGGAGAVCRLEPPAFSFSQQ